MAQATETTKAKVKSTMTEEQAALIEQRLNLADGVTQKELGALMMGRYGYEKEIDEKLADPKYHREYLAPNDRAEVEKLEAQRRDRFAREREIQKWTTKVGEHLEATYGEKRHDGNGAFIGYGERVEFKKDNGHLKLKW